MRFAAWPALVAALLVPVETSFVPLAHAQDAASPVTGPNASPPAIADVVALKDGSRFRGTITELVPTDHVDLLLPSGQTRRFASADVTYAGASTGAPGATSGALVPPATGTPAPPPLPAMADLHVAANMPDVQLLARVRQGDMGGFGFGGGAIVFGGETHDYAILCTAPCDLKLPLGGMRFALSHEGGSAVEAADPLVLRGPATLRATYESRRGIRLAGIGVLLAGLATATILLAVGETKTPCGPGVVSAGPCYQTHFAPGYFAGGVAALTVGTAAGIVMMLMKDKASLELVPMVSARSLAPRGVASDARSMTGDPSGMDLRLTF